MNKFFKVLFPLLLLVVITSCQQESKPPSTKKIVLNLQEGDPPSLNPYVGVDLRSRCIFLALFEPLMRRSIDGTLEPAAAKNFEVDSTQKVYTFHIRPHLWSNGHRVTSSHFAEAWRYALTPNSHCIRSDLFYPIKNAEKVKKGELPLSALGISTPDENTLIVHLDHPTPYFLDLTATSFFAPLFVPSNEEPTLFNGPYVVGKRVHDQQLTLKKNLLFWDPTSVEVEEIEFTIVKDPMTALAMFENGELDLVGDPLCSLPFDVIPQLENAGQLKSKMISRMFYLLLNSDVYPFHCTPLRKALGLSIDRGQLTEHLFFGEYPSLSLLPKPLSLLEDDEFEHYEDPGVLFEQALEELQLTRETFPKLVFSYCELSGQKKLSEFIQEQWKKKLGIEVDIQCSEWNVHISNLRKGNYQIGTLHLTTLYQDPMFYFDLYRDKKALCNYCHWENDQFRSLLEQSEKTLDPNKRRELLVQAERKLFEEMPAIPLFTQNFQYLMKNNVQLEISDLGIYDFRSARLR